MLQAETQALKNIQKKVASSNLNQRINQRGIIDAVKQSAREAVRKTDLEGIAAANGKRGTRAHTILENSIPKINDRFRRTGFGATAEQFRLPSPGNGIAGDVVRKRLLNSKGLDVVITKNDKLIKGLDLKTGNAKFSNEFKRDLKIRFDLNDIEEINIK